MEAVQWSSPNDQQQLQQYLWYEVRRALDARQPLEGQWRRWLQQYMAPAKQATRDFPWIGASNFEMPSTGADVDEYFAEMMQSVHADPDLWVVQAMNPDWQAAAKPLQDFLAVADRTMLKMPKVNGKALLELCKLGTCVWEHGWDYSKRPVNKYDDAWNTVQVDQVVSKPFVDHIRLVDFLIPPDYYDIDPDAQFGAPWVAKRIYLTKEQLLTAAGDTQPAQPNIGLTDALKVINFEMAQQNPMDQKIQQLQYAKDASAQRDTDFLRTDDTNSASTGGGVGILRRKIELWEVHVRWTHGQPDPTTGEVAAKAQSPSDLVVLFHLPTYTIIRANYNPYLHGKRPFEKAVFFPTEGFYGIGLCEQGEVFQKMGSEFWNMMADNVTIGNAPMMGAKAGSNIAPGEPIFPSKFLITDGNPREELFPMQFGAGAYPGLVEILSMVDQQRVRRNGVGDLQRGNIGGLPGRTPATSVQAMLAEGKKRPDLVLKDVRTALGTIGLRMIQLFQQYIGTPVEVDGKKYLAMAMETLGPLEGKHAVDKLQTPLQDAELGLGVQIAATSATANKDMQTQMLTGLLTLNIQIVPQLVQLAQAAQQGAGTLAGDIAGKGLTATLKLMERVYEQHDIHDAEELVPQPPEPMGPQETSGAGTPVQPDPSAGGGNPPVAAAGGVGALPLGTTTDFRANSLGGA